MAIVEYGGKTYTLSDEQSKEFEEQFKKRKKAEAWEKKLREDSELQKALKKTYNPADLITTYYPEDYIITGLKMKPTETTVSSMGTQQYPTNLHQNVAVPFQTPYGVYGSSNGSISPGTGSKSTDSLAEYKEYIDALPMETDPDYNENLEQLSEEEMNEEIF